MLQITQPVQGCDAYGNFKELLTAMEGDLGSVLDWRRTTFWRERRFHRAWEAFWCRVKSQPRYQASHWEDIFRVTLQTHGCGSCARLDACTSPHLRRSACLAAWLILYG